MKYVGAVVGAVIGFYVGGPTGAIYGAELGYSIGGIIDASNEKIVTEGPRLTDLRTTISSNGRFIPRVYVYAGGIGGNIIDSTPLIPQENTTETSSGKGGPTAVSKTTTYSATFRVLVCKSDGTHKIQWIKANGNLIWSREPGTEVAGILATTTLVQRVTVYDGSDDQLPDPFFEALNGIGNEPAYLGILSVVFEAFQLANYSNNIAATQLTFGVVENVAETNEQPINSGFLGAMLDKNSMWLYETFFDGYTTRMSSPPVLYRDFFDGSGPQRIGTFTTIDLVRSAIQTTDLYAQCPPIQQDYRFYPANDFEGIVVGPTPMVYRLEESFGTTSTVYSIYDYQAPPILQCQYVYKTSVDLGVSAIAFYSPIGDVVFGKITVANDVTVTMDYLSWRAGKLASTSSDSDAVRTERRAVSFGNDQLGFIESIAQPPVSGDTTRRDNYVALKSGKTPTIFTIDGERVCGFLMTASHAYLLVTQSYVSGTGYLLNLRVYKQIAGVFTLDATWVGPRLTSFGNAALFEGQEGIGVYVAGALKWAWDATGVLTVTDGTSTGSDTEGWPPKTMAYTDPSFFVFRGQIAADATHPHAVPATYVHTDTVGTPDPQALRLTIAKIAAEKNVTLLDFEDLPDSVTCRGYIITRPTSPRVAIDYLRDLYRVDMTERAASLAFVLRGGAVARTLTDADLGAYEGDPSDSNQPDRVLAVRADELKQPQQVQLQWTDVDNNFETGTYIAKRETTDSQGVATLDATAVMMTGTEAARFAEAALADAWLGADTYQLSTTYRHEDLEPTDVVILPGKVKGRRARLRQKTDKGGLCEWQAVRDDPSTLPANQVVIGGSVSNSTAVGSQGSIIGGPVARVDVLNLPMLRTADDEGGWYGFVYSTDGTRFRGADVYDNASTVPNRVGSVPGGAKIRGITTTVLANYTGPNCFDLGSHVDVLLPTDALPESVTRAQLFAGSSWWLIGDEIVGVRVVTMVSAGVWRLTELLRGLRGTDAAIATHAVSEAVYRLEVSSMIRDRTASNTGTALTNISVGAVSIGRSASDLTNFATTGTNTSQALQPFTPINLASGVTADGGMLFRWTFRSRIPFDFGADAPLGEDTEEYAIDFGTDNTFRAGTTQYSLSQQLVLSAAELRALPAGFSWRVRQLQSGKGTVALTRPVRSIPLSDLTPMPADTLPNTVLLIDPSGVADGGTLTDASASPGTLTGWSASVYQGRIRFSDQAFGALSIFNDTAFKFGSLDWSIEFDIILTSKPGRPAIDGGDGGSIVKRSAKFFGPGQFETLVFLSSAGPLSEAADSGALVFYQGDAYAAGESAELMRGSPHLNDGLAHTVRLAFSGGTYFMGIDGKTVDAHTYDGPVSDITGCPLTFGPFRGSLGKITVKTS